MEIKFRFCPTIWASVKELAGALQCASGRASVRVEARFRYASSPKGIRVRVQDMEEARLRCAFQTWRVEDGRVSFDVVEQKMKWMQVSEKNPNPFQVPTLFLSWTPLALLCFPVFAVQVLLSPFSPHFVFILSLSLSSSIYFFPFYELQHKCHLFLIPHYCDLLAK